MALDEDTIEIDSEEKDIVDSLGDEDEIVPVKYSISSYGADYVVDALVKRMKNEDIYVPPFQRKFIWSLRQASRFIESLLLGLPIPGIFLSRDEETRKLLVIDGQQRLRSLYFFYEGIFADSGREFALEGVQPQFKGKTYKSLMPEDRRQLDDSIIHATIIKQDEPSDDNSSVYFIFERLNTTGTKLTHQEIRATIYLGEFNNLLGYLNKNPSWRSMYGRISNRRRDQEFILRFFALYYFSSEYSPPMRLFLNKYMNKNRHLEYQSAGELTHIFTKTVGTMYQYLGKRAFRPVKAFNAAVFDAVMVGVARRLEKGNIDDGKAFREHYETLLKDKAFLEAIRTGTTASVISVTDRIKLAIEAFHDVE